ncbi:hypothetical protein GXW78_16960 [Roseomonas terrae]|uniref:Uncharacterized protein n=1 Tax=Neoroseomonas terrae TaxID=424799 RepID=A0ABS5EK03_9PROT|nr:hypothetical protein [Neoroseomonas terrae]MBR0651366.1 hypothetical protein [Neoroseomonas terrae]
MTRDGALARQVVRLPVRLGVDDRVDLTVALRFNAAGALVGISANLPPAPRSSEAERQAAMLVEAISAKLQRRRDIGVTELRRRAELAFALLEDLEALEDTHGPDARRLLAPPPEAAA